MPLWKKKFYYSKSTFKVGSEGWKGIYLNERIKFDEEVKEFEFRIKIDIATLKIKLFSDLLVVGKKQIMDYIQQD